MRCLILIAFIGTAVGQVRIPGPGGSVGTVSANYTGYFGNTGQAPGSIDNGALQMFASPFVTGSDSGYTVSGLMAYITSPQAATWGLALYGDTTSGCGVGLSHCPNASAPICAATTSTAPSSGYNTLSPTGCGTLSASTWYWVAYASASGAQNIATGNAGPCDYQGVPSVYDTAVLGSLTFPTGWTAASTGNCYTVFAKLNYNSSAQYQIIQSSWSGINAPTTTSYSFPILPTGAGHTLIVGVATDVNESAAVPTVSDSAVDTITTRTSAYGSSAQGIQIASIDRVSAGVTSVTVSGVHSTDNIGVYIIELAGTATASFDVAASNTTPSISPFTSATTATTANASEFLFGIASNHDVTVGTYAGTGGWTLFGNQQSYQGGGTSYGGFWRIVFATGAYNLTGSFSAGTSAIVSGLATFR